MEIEVLLSLIKTIMTTLLHTLHLENNVFFTKPRTFNGSKYSTLFFFFLESLFALEVQNLVQGEGRLTNAH